MSLIVALVWLTLVGSCGVLISLWRGSWWWQFRWLATLLLVQGVLLQLVTLAISTQHRAYRIVFLVGTVVGSFLLTAAVAELVETIFARFRGLQSTSRLVVRVAAVGATVFGLVTAWDAMGPTTTRFHFWFTMALSLQRGLLVSLTIFLVVVLGVMAVLRAKLPAQQVAYAAVFCAFFLAKAGALLYFEWAGRGAIQEVRAGLMGIQVLCLFAWMGIFLAWRGESSLGRSATDAELPPEDYLTQRVSAANTALDKLYRR